MNTSEDETLNTQAVVRWLRNELRADPTFIDVLREVIDEVSEEISDDDLFELLKPCLSYPWPPQKNTSLPTISPDSVDMLFHPGVRRKLKEWQQASFDSSLKKSQQAKAGYNIETVFRRLLFKGSGPKKHLSPTDEDEIFRQRQNVERACKEIIEDSSLAENPVARKRELIKEKFQWCTNLPDCDESLTKAVSTKRAEEMRARVLAIRYNCHPRTIKEIIRNKGEGFREFRKVTQKNPHIKSLKIEATGSSPVGAVTPLKTVT